MPPAAVKKKKKAKQQKLKWWMAPVAILAVCGVAVATILLFKPSIGSSHLPAAKQWDVDCAGAKATDFKCLQTHYQNMIAARGIAAAFVDVKDAYQKSPYVKSNCHQLVHVIGRAAGDKFLDVAKAYEQGDDFCWSGYYHGVMESVIGKIGYAAIGAKLDTICATISKDNRYSFYHYNCAHGLGHGVMAVDNGELFDALHTCDNLTDSWERESCYGGVFMENVMNEVNPDHHTNYLKKDDLVYPCNAVERPYKQQCYLMQTSHALQSTGYNFDQIFGMCDGVEADFRPTCYQSLGRDASGSTISNAEQTRDLCMKGKDFAARSNCVIGAVKDFISYHHSNAEGEKLCAVLEPKLNEMCMSTSKGYSVAKK